jgi:hypothetical protein
MKRVFLSMFLLAGFWLTSEVGLFGGGDVHYTPDMAPSQSRQGSSDTAKTGAKENATGIRQQETAENQGTVSCANAQASGCANNDSESAK